MRTVLVVGHEWRFRVLLRAQLREQGYEALGYETLEEAAAKAARLAPPPAAVVFDTTDAPAEERGSSLVELGERLPVLVVAAAGEQLDLPSVTVLRRPLRVGDVVASINSLLKARP